MQATTERSHGQEEHMASGNGAGDGDIRRVPETFKLADWPRNCWYAAAYDVELKRELLPIRRRSPTCTGTTIPNGPATGRSST